MKIVAMRFVQSGQAHFDMVEKEHLIQYHPVTESLEMVESLPDRMDEHQPKAGALPSCRLVNTGHIHLDRAGDDRILSRLLIPLEHLALVPLGYIYDLYMHTFFGLMGFTTKRVRYAYSATWPVVGRGR